MKRAAPLRRCGRTRPGAAATKRRAAGGKGAVGRASATKAEMVTLRRALAARSGGLCEVGRTCAGCTPDREVHRATDMAHIIPRSAGGPDTLTNVLHLCRAHHRREDAPYAKGRLVYYREWLTQAGLGTLTLDAYSMSAISLGQRELMPPPTHVRWAIEVRMDKRAPLARCVASGVIAL